MFIATWAPPVSRWLSFGVVFWLYLGREGFKEKYSHYLLTLGLTVLSFRIVFASLLSIFQYWIWAGDKFASSFLKTPLTTIGNPFLSNSPLGYYTFYIFERFWFNLLVSLAFALIFFWFLKTLEKYRARFFDDGETRLGGLLAFLVGWPNSIIFILISFVAVVFISAYRLIGQKGKLTTLGLPFVASACLVLLFGQTIIELLGLFPLYI